MKTREKRKMHGRGDGFKHLAGLLVMAFIAGTAQLQAEEAAPQVTGDIYVVAVNKYLFRGADFSPVSGSGNTSGLMFQPGLDLYVGPFTLAIWNSMSDLGTFDEMDFTGSYASTFGKSTVSGGFTAYSYPSLLLGDTFEFFGKIAFDVLSAPSLGIYYDIVLGTLYAELKAGHSFSFESIEGFEVALGASAGYTMLPSDLSASAPSVLGLSVIPSYAIGPMTLSLTGFYQIALDDAYDSDWYVGVGTSFEF
jgi:hypothetical protein